MTEKDRVEAIRDVIGALRTAAMNDMSALEPSENYNAWLAQYHHIAGRMEALRTVDEITRRLAEVTR